ncbi:response regulator transcription factor [Actinocrispum wychmicini]|uniref:response regulator transcription factor n=1 Tax=Actinocrispum wychmicini TaxID=1213861 RepID=UPI001FB84B96|nr:helix-turn-helix transcriptional regulator [Actinocrispum wychmicini]
MRRCGWCSGPSLLATQVSALDSRLADHPLTPRQVEVAGLVAKGYTNKQLATALHIAERTAESHVRNIMTTLGFQSRSQIATWSTQHQGPPELSPSNRPWCRTGEVFEDRSRSPPQLVGVNVVVGAVERVAETVESGGFVVLVAELAREGQRLLVVVDGLGVVPEAMVGVAEAVRRARPSFRVRQVAVQVQGVPASGDALCEVPEQRVVPAQDAERSHPSGLRRPAATR